MTAQLRPGEEGLGEIAASLADEFQEGRTVLTPVVSLLNQLASLAPDEPESVAGVSYSMHEERRNSLA